MRPTQRALLARGYLCLTAAAAAGMQLYWLAIWRGPLPDDLLLFGLLLALAVLAQHFPVAVARRRKVDVSVAAYFASVLLFGAPGAVAFVGLAQLVGQLTLALRRNAATGKRLRTVRSALFNTSQAMVAAGAAALVYYVALPHLVPAPLNRWENVWALPAAAIALYAVNSLAVAVMIALQLDHHPFRVWAEGRRRNLLEFAGLFLVGVAVARAGAGDPLIVLVMALPTAVVYWSMDRTVRLEELARREAELAAWRDLERMKAEFMRSVSHELRAPLSLIVGFAELLRDQTTETAADPDAADFAGQIHTNAQLLMRLVDDLLDFSRIERGEVTIEPQDFDLVPLLQDLLTGLRHQPGGERLAGSLPASLPVHADPARVSQSVYNLLVNAQKYAPQGPIVLRASRVLALDGSDGLTRPDRSERPDRAAGDDGMVRVEVEDQGPGIPIDQQPHVWEKFYRGSEFSGLNVAPGAGIGLAIVKALVEAQGGQVGLFSIPGQGARFWIDVPAAERSTLAHPHGRTVHQPTVARLVGGSTDTAA